VPPLNDLLYYWTIIDAVTLFRIFLPNWDFRGFFQHLAGRNSKAAMCGGEVCSAQFCVLMSLKIVGAQRGHNPSAKDIFVKKKTFSLLGNFNDLDVIV
jgi:hypothetical protein